MKEYKISREDFEKLKGDLYLWLRFDLKDREDEHLVIDHDTVVVIASKPPYDRFTPATKREFIERAEAFRSTIEDPIIIGVR